ncbi:MAG: carboxypeptidase-like regulatory domain-containing protein, partial [Acidobacteriota bacterium]
MRHSLMLALLLAAFGWWGLTAGAGVASAQGGAVLTGTVTRAGGTDAMAGAAVVVEELHREARTAADGTYRIDGLVPGRYHVSVRAEGYS